MASSGRFSAVRRQRAASPRALPRLPTTASRRSALAACVRPVAQVQGLHDLFLLVVQNFVRGRAGRSTRSCAPPRATSTPSRATPRLRRRRPTPSERDAEGRDLFLTDDEARRVAEAERVRETEARREAEGRLRDAEQRIAELEASRAR